MPGNTQRLNSFRSTFKPYFPQVGDTERKAMQDRRGPQRVCFSWAVRHEVTTRATDEDVDNGLASYPGQALAFNKDKQLAAPAMTFASGRNYCNWKMDQAQLCDCYADCAPEEDDEVPDWMLDMEAEDHIRSKHH